jgi:predicted DNA binding CopG/RHH family protein
VEKAKAKATKAISIRLPVTGLAFAKQIAARQGVGYQTVLKRAIREGLKDPL